MDIDLEILAELRHKLAVLLIYENLFGDLLLYSVQRSYYFLQFSMSLYYQAHASFALDNKGKQLVDSFKNGGEFSGVAHKVAI